VELRCEERISHSPALTSYVKHVFVNPKAPVMVYDQILKLWYRFLNLQVRTAACVLASLLLLSGGEISTGVCVRWSVLCVRM
jgi:hypothetical protein